MHLPPVTVPANSVGHRLAITSVELARPGIITKVATRHPPWLRGCRRTTRCGQKCACTRTQERTTARRPPSARSARTVACTRRPTTADADTARTCSTGTSGRARCAAAHSRTRQPRHRRAARACGGGTGRCTRRAAVADPGAASSSRRARRRAPLSALQRDVAGLRSLIGLCTTVVGLSWG